MDLLHIASWVAIFVLASSYWFQIWKIHKHKEVRDLSIAYYVLLVIGYTILMMTAYVENSLIFLVKQIATFIPVVIIIAQIFKHRQDKWHDDKDACCFNCKTELEPDWKYCPECGDNTKEEQNSVKKSFKKNKKLMK